METAAMSKWALQLVQLLASRCIDPTFRFPAGAAAQHTVAACMDALEREFAGVSRQRIVDFCVCQVYAMTFYKEGTLRQRWRVAHSFGAKALERFRRNEQRHRYWEDRWLAQHGIVRAQLVEMLRDRTQHPLAKFIYPEYEDRTKRRQAGSEAGLYICTRSTLLWTPFSPVCRACAMAVQCRTLEQRRYPELLRIREEQYGKGGGR